MVQYLGASSPADLVPFGISSAGDLVDLVSRVSPDLTTCFNALLNDPSS